MSQSRPERCGSGFVAFILIGNQNCLNLSIGIATPYQIWSSFLMLYCVFVHLQLASDIVQVYFEQFFAPCSALFIPAGRVAH